MKKYIPLAVIVILIAGFLILRKPVAVTPESPIQNTPTETTPESPATNTTQSQTTTPTKPDYSYTNSDFHFAVSLPGLVATKKPSDPNHKLDIFTFGVGDQSSVPEEKRIKNTMVVYIWHDKAEFDAMMAGGTGLDKETINGHEFTKYSFSNEDSTVYRYTIAQGADTYDVGVTDPKNISKFYLLK